MPEPTNLACVDALRALAIDTVQAANSGHPGLPLGAAPMVYALWRWHLTFDPRAPAWPDRDRFVLSAGHGSALLYAVLHLSGYALGLDDLRAFRRLGSRTPGHPEAHVTPGVEMTTGPLGQGAAAAVGAAIAERSLAARFNRPGFEIVNHHTYALVSDGDLMEGVSAEAASLAGHLGLGKLIYLYDDNGVTLDGPTSACFTEDVAKRYAALGWHVQEVRDGDTDLDGIRLALEVAKRDPSKPHLISVRTTLGYGSPRAGKNLAHGSPLGPDGVRLTKKALGIDPDLSFFVPDAELRAWRETGTRGVIAHAAWDERMAGYERAHPELAEQWRQACELALPGDFDAALPEYPAGLSVSTRKAAGEALEALAPKVPWLIGGDADLSSSTLTRIGGAGDFDGRTGTGRNIRYGVREHAMAAVSNGIACHGGLRPFAGTFFSFSDYMKPAIRLAALDSLPVIYVFTHDSVWLGEDGPTHQPIEQLAALRALPNLVVIRPADANEAVAAWRYALTRREGPTALVLTRQNVPVLEHAGARAAEVSRGAYVLTESVGGPAEVVLIASGSEVAVAAEAHASLSRAGRKVRLVSMPSWELFAAQDPAYQASVLPPDLRARVSVEAAATLGWARWTGTEGIALGLDHFGASGSAEALARHFALNAESVVRAAEAALVRAEAHEANPGERS